jgi:hypothetical protein
MSNSFLNELYSKYGIEKPICENNGIIGVGWVSLIENFLIELKKQKIKFKIVQIKEKFGKLRIYCDDSCTDSKEFAKLADKFSNKANNICTFCSAQGKIRNCFNYFLCICSKCKDKIKTRNDINLMIKDDQ